MQEDLRGRVLVGVFEEVAGAMVQAKVPSGAERGVMIR